MRATKYGRYFCCNMSLMLHTNILKLRLGRITTHVIHPVLVEAMCPREEPGHLQVKAGGEPELLLDVTAHVIEVAPRLEETDKFNVRHKVQIERALVESVRRHLAVLWPTVARLAD